jgi:hypothetical protein
VISKPRTKMSQLQVLCRHVDHAVAPLFATHVLLAAFLTAAAYIAMAVLFSALSAFMACPGRGLLSELQCQCQLHGSGSWG